MQEDPELTAVVRSRQLHIYRNGKKVLILAGKAAPRSSERIHCAGCCQRKSRDKAYLTRWNWRKESSSSQLYLESAGSPSLSCWLTESWNSRPWSTISGLMPWWRSLCCYWSFCQQWLYTSSRKNNKQKQIWNTETWPSFCFCWQQCYFAIYK